MPDPRSPYFPDIRLPNPVEINANDLKTAIETKIQMALLPHLPQHTQTI
ncbi:hypothetical protein [Acidiphilium acidophilum]|nr:hypothetical protein [Acidiphilium acidophilum]